MEQEGGASVGADSAGGRPGGCSCPRPVLRPQVPTGESETKPPGNMNTLYLNMRRTTETYRKGHVTGGSRHIKFEIINLVSSSVFMIVT